MLKCGGTGLAIAVKGGPMAVALSISKLANIQFAVWPTEASAARLLIMLELTVVDHAVGPPHATFPMHLTLPPLTNVVLTIGKQISSLAIKQILLELALIDRPIRRGVHASTMSTAGQKLPFETAAIHESLKSQSCTQTVIPSTVIRGSISIPQRSQAMLLAILELAFEYVPAAVM
jgi:hypothetical protein